MALQLNSKSFKDGRNILGEYKVARYTIADKCNECNSEISKLTQSIKDSLAKIEKIENGSLVTSRKVDSFKEEIEQKRAEIKDYQSMIASVKEAQEEAIKRAEALVSKEFVKSAKAYTSDVYNESAKIDLLTHVVKFFNSLGLEDVKTSDVEVYINGLGASINSNRGISENGKLTKGQSNIAKLFLGIVIDEPKMKKILESYEYKFQFQYEKKMKKAKSDN